MRVLIAAGGTGGHIPVSRWRTKLCAAIQLRRSGLWVRPVAWKIVWRRMRGLNYRSLKARLKNVSMAARLRGLFVLPKSIFAARRLIREFRPDIVVGAGGYVSGPVLLAAAMLGWPTLVMDSNALPGWTNRRLARFVDKATVSFQEALPFFRGKGVLTGNPVRSEFFEIPAKPRDAKRFDLLIFGVAGARAINDAMIAALPHLAGKKTLCTSRIKLARANSTKSNADTKPQTGRPALT